MRVSKADPHLEVQPAQAAGLGFTMSIGTPYLGAQPPRTVFFPRSKVPLVLSKERILAAVLADLRSEFFLT